MIKKLKLRLFESSPYCYWCGQKLYYPPRRLGRVLDHAATLDHIFAKDDKRRKKGGDKIVLSCYLCNNTRSNMKPEDWAKIKSKEFNIKDFEKTSTSRRKEKIELLKYSPYCHWCRRKVFLTSTYNFKDKEHVNHAATLDHIFAKNDKRREQAGGKVKVLSCYLCNTTRSNMSPEDWAKIKSKEFNIKDHV